MLPHRCGGAPFGHVGYADPSRGSLELVVENLQEFVKNPPGSLVRELSLKRLPQETLATEGVSQGDKAQSAFVQ